MREQGAASQEAPPEEVADVPAVAPDPRIEQLVRRLGSVGGPAHSGREPRQPSPQGVGARECEPRSVAPRDEPPVEVLQGPGLLPELRQVGLETGRPPVHERIPRDRPDPAAPQDVEGHPGAPHRAHVQQAGTSRGEKLHEREDDARGQGVGGVRGLHGPDALGQPGHQGPVLRHAPEQRLAEVDMRLHEPGRR